MGDLPTAFFLIAPAAHGHDIVKVMTFAIVHTVCGQHRIYLAINYFKAEHVTTPGTVFTKTRLQPIRCHVIVYKLSAVLAILSFVVVHLLGKILV